MRNARGHKVGDESPCRPGHNTPFPLEGSPPRQIQRLLGGRIRVVNTNLGTFAKINREALKHRYGLSIPSWALKARCAQKVDSGLLKAAV